MNNSSLLEFKPDTVDHVRKLYNLEKKEKLEQCIDILEAWVLKQDHFVKKKYSRKYLEMQIISTKGSIEKAKMKLDKMCTMRTLLPKFFEFSDLRKEFGDIFRTLCVGFPLPYLTENHYRVLPYKMMRGHTWNTLKYTDVFKLFVILYEYLKLHDYAAGYVFVWDISEVTIMEVISKLNLIEFKQWMSLLLEGQGMRIKSINFVSSSNTIDTLLKLMKSVLSAKLGDRMRVHKTYEELHRDVPRELLPIELGGPEISFKNLQENWLNLLAQTDNIEYLKDIQKAGVDERIKKIDRIDEFAGVAGSFVSLNVD